MIDQQIIKNNVNQNNGSNYKDIGSTLDVINSPYKQKNLTPKNRKNLGIDDIKSNFSGISKVSKFTNNLLNKSNNGVNDQWY